MQPNGDDVKPLVDGVDLSTVGGRLKYLRDKVLGLSTQEMADALRRRGVGKGATHGSVNRYESGERDPPPAYIAAMAELAGVTADWIIFGPRPAQDASAIDRAHMEEIARVIDKWRAARAAAISAAEDEESNTVPNKRPSILDDHTHDGGLPGTGTGGR